MKRIIVLCDGTGQSASRGELAVPTNVHRLGHALINDPNGSGADQIVFYQSGVGTGDLGWMGDLKQGAIGDGIENNITDGYNFVMNNYIPGDELFIFGFSRGAYTARVLANFIARVGMFSKSFSWEFKLAWKAYVAGPTKLDPYLEQLEKNVSTDKAKYDANQKSGKFPFVPRVYSPKIKVVGCWDTVASLGLPWNPISDPGGVSGEYAHFDGSLAPGIEHAFHALALDECRGPFTPTLWYLPEDKEVVKTIDLRQCWFPGVHTNVGGGYPDQAIADLTLAWMIDLCRPFLDFDTRYIGTLVDLNHQPWKIRSKHREANPDGFDRVYQGWARGKQYDSYKKGQTWTWRYRTPGGYSASVDRTCEVVHASVRERWSARPENRDWRPPALKGFEPKQSAGGRWEWVKEVGRGKILVLEEEPFEEKGKGSFEWLLRYAPVQQPPEDKPGK